MGTQGGDVGPRIVQRLPALPESLHGLLADTAAGAVGCRAVFEVWGLGETLEDCVASTARVSADHIRSRISGSWRLQPCSLGTRQRRHSDQRVARMAVFTHVLDAIEGRPVDLRTPDHRLWLVEAQRFLQDGSPLPEPPPRHLLLYQLPASRPSVKEQAAKLDLRKRAFLSTSTLPARRSLLLCNLALAHAPMTGPACSTPTGSGGVLLTGGALGADTVGSISTGEWSPTIGGPPRFHRRSTARTAARKRCACATTSTKPGLRRRCPALLELDVGAPDAAERLLEANGGARYHALVCDPPYGRREFQHGTEAWDGALTFQVHEAALTGTLQTLLALAAATLRPRGRLVFLVPVRAPRDLRKPTLEGLAELLRAMGGRMGFELGHMGVEVVHHGLHRAVVVLTRTD